MMTTVAKMRHAIMQYVFWSALVAQTMTTDGFVAPDNNYLIAPNWKLLAVDKARTMPIAATTTPSALFHRGRSERTPPAPFFTRRNKDHLTRRQVSVTSSETSTSAKQEFKKVVIYQKIVRPQTSGEEKISSSVFLSFLVEYLQDQFVVPRRLPMVYEKELNILDESKFSDEDQSKNFPLLYLDSPLSNEASETRMGIEVVAISPSSSSSQNGGAKGGDPNMAMVVVTKKKDFGDDGSRNGVMMQNLFRDSEKRILGALDRGLDDFCSGKFKPNSMKKVEQKKEKDDAIDVEASVKRIKSLDDALAHEYGVGDTDAVMDAIAKQEVDLELKREGKEEEPQKNAPEVTEPQQDQENMWLPSTNDFAVEAAKQVVEKRRTSGADDFAVQAAKKVAKTKANGPKTTKSKSAQEMETLGKKVPELENSEEKQSRPAAKKSKKTSKKKTKKGKLKKKPLVPKIDEQGRWSMALNDMPKKPKSTSFSFEASSPSNGAVTPEPPKKKKVAAKQPRKVDAEPVDIKPAHTIQEQLEKEKAKLEKENTIISTLATEVKDVVADKPDTPSTASSKPARKQSTKTSTSASSIDVSTVKPSSLDTAVEDFAVQAAKVAVEKQRKRKAPSKKAAKKAHGAPSVTSNDSMTTRVGAKNITEEERVRSLDNLIMTSAGDVVDEKLNPKDEAAQMPSDEQLQIDIAKEAQRVMDDLAAAGRPMSPEELLEDVVNFGEAQARENAPGAGFVSGAFEKANEIVQERSKQIKDKSELGFKELDDKPQPDIAEQVDEKPHSSDLSGSSSDPKKSLTKEEELKKIFEAGEKAANEMITLAESTSANVHRKKTTDADIDQLIDSDTSVTNYARKLDDELVELEMRISKTPGEELDGPNKAPMFDIFSGPELYNPNVDPETAVNWPGAMPGTKEVELPRELDAAVKQAQFAARMLIRMEEVQEEDEDGTKRTRYFVDKRELDEKRVKLIKDTVENAVAIGIIRDPLEYLEERSRMAIVLNELKTQPEERHQDILSTYKDLMLSENFISLVKERMIAMAQRDLDARRRGNEDEFKEEHLQERELMTKMTIYAQVLLKEARLLGAELEATQLELIRSICEVAMDPKYTTEEEAAMALTDTVRDMRPMLDENFVAYLKYAIAEEEGKLARAGVLDDPEYNHWLFILKIIQQGVYKEIAVGINRYIEHIFYVLRMETRGERRALLKELIDVMPTLDVRPFVKVVDNIVSSLGTGTRGDFEGVHVLGGMTNKLLQLHHDVKELLPPERIKKMSRDADEWAERKRLELLEHRKKAQERIKQRRLEGGPRGEILDRFD